MKARPTDLEAIDASLLSIQDEFREHFGWGLAADLESAHALRAAIEESNVDIWSRAQRARTVAALHRRLVLRATDIALLGAAVTTAEIETALTDNTLLIAADGATGVLSTLPDSLAERAWSRLACVVSDADGGEGTVAAVKRGIPMILHAHGDNIDAWTELLALASSRRTPPPIVLTHQTPESIAGMHNPGGFTDGDRAACFARALGVPRERIRLLGTRTDIVGEWSGSSDPEQKLLKLQWMAKVLQYLGFWV